VAVEAAAFGKPAIRLIESDAQTLPRSVVSRFYRVDARTGTVAFWANILDGADAPGTSEPPPMPLRRRFGVSWGYTPEMTEPVSYLIETDTIVRFSCGDNGPGFCLFGWSQAESWGVWSDGPVSLCRFVPAAEVGPFVAGVVFGGFVPDTSSPLMLSVSVSTGTGRDSRTFQIEDDRLVALTVPFETRTAWDGAELMFRMPDRKSPLQLGLSGDSRVLGIGLRTMTVRRGSGVWACRTA
jgi:hypothetical protein